MYKLRAESRGTALICFCSVAVLSLTMACARGHARHPWSHSFR